MGFLFSQRAELILHTQTQREQELIAGDGELQET